MIGDFFGAVPGSSSQVFGAPFAEAITFNKQAYLGGNDARLYLDREGTSGAHEQ